MINMLRLILLSTILMQSLLAQVPQMPSMPKIAVLNFAVRGDLKKIEADLFINKFRTEMANVAGWHVLTTAEMAESLQDLNAEVLRAANLQDACRIGEKLEASLIIFGLLARQDSLCGLRLFNFDLRHERQRNDFTTSFSTGDSAAMNAISDILTKLDIGPNINVQPNDSTGVLFLTSSPDSAMVFLNNEFAGCTPLRIGFLKPKEYKLVVAKPPYKPTRGVVSIRRNQLQEYQTTLHRDITVLVESTPPGAQIYVNDVPVGLTPKKIRLTSGTFYHFRFALADFAEINKKLAFDNDKTLTIDFTNDRKKWIYWGSGGAATLGLIYYLANRGNGSHGNNKGGLPAPPGRP